MTDKLLVVRDDSGAAVHAIEVNGKSDREIEKIEMGMLRQMDTERFTVGLEER